MAGSLSRIPHDIEETNLVDFYPNELINFMLYLNKCETGPWSWIDFRGIIDRLLAKSLSADMELGLLELLALRVPQ